MIIDWNPMDNSPHDFSLDSDQKLMTKDGEQVTIERLPDLHFIIRIGEQKTHVYGDSRACYFLNRNFVGLDQAYMAWLQKVGYCLESENWAIELPPEPTCKGIDAPWREWYDGGMGAIEAAWAGVRLVAESHIRGEQ